MWSVCLVSVELPSHAGNHARCLGLHDEERGQSVVGTDAGPQALHAGEHLGATPSHHDQPSLRRPGHHFQGCRGGWGGGRGSNPRPRQAPELQGAHDPQAAGDVGEVRGVGGERVPGPRDCQEEHFHPAEGEGPFGEGEVQERDAPHPGGWS